MINEYYPINVLTHSGIVELSYIVPGDYVYEYKTGNFLKVLNVTKPTKCIIYQITYNDKRIDFIGNNDFIFTGKNIIDVTSVNRNTTFSEIIQNPINFNKVVIPNIDPDPYLAGAFLIYGDYNDKYINLPYDMNGINDVFLNKHSVTSILSESNNNKIYFKYTGDHENKKITWNRFFNTYSNININKRNKKSPIVPSIYSRGSIKDRIQFIRGVFDVGYSSKIFKNNTIGIIHNNVRNLKQIQEILWSLGILSKIEFDKYINSNNKYKLEILGKYNGYPGFIYNINEIENLLSNNIINSDKFKLSIDKISNNNISGLRYNIGYMSNLILEKPQAIYLNDKFLPRVSI